MAKVARMKARLSDVRGFIGGLYGPDLHAKRVDSLAGATLGVMAGASLAVAMIGQALALARGLVTKHAVKQVDRLLSNQGIDVWDSFARWVPQQIGARPDVLVAMDWTDFDHDGQSTLVLSLVTGHGRAAPLIWLTVWKEEIATRRNDYEDACLRRLGETMPAGCRVTILADRVSMPVECSPEVPIENSPLRYGSIASVSAWRLGVGELRQVEVNDCLECRGRGGVAQGVRQGIGPGGVVGLQGEQFSNGGVPALGTGAAIHGPAIADGGSRLPGFAGAVTSLAFGVAERRATFCWQVCRHGRLRYVTLDRRSSWERRTVQPACMLSASVLGGRPRRFG